MALAFLSGSGSGSSAIKYFDIRLDSNYVIFRGAEHEAASAAIQGSVVLCLAEPLTIKHLKLTLNGINRISWQVGSGAALGGRKLSYKERTFFEKTWNFRDAGKSKTEILPADNYEFPFDLIVDGSMPESVEGLEHSWVVYRFKAEIGRKYQKDIVIRKPLRIVRTLDSGALELSHAMSVENTWVDKIDYTISTPTKAIVYGTALQVDFRLVPLLKGLVMGTVTTQVKEEHEFSMEPDLGANGTSHSYKFDRVVVHDEYTIDTESDTQILDEEVEGYRFSRYLELPKSLSLCIQDCNVKGVKIRHKIKFNIQLHNPDGHISELRANLPVSFYISPILPLGENNALVDQTPHAGRQAVDNDVANSAPPLYGQHELDQIFSSGLGACGYHTPGVFSTPGTPLSLSRNMSSENLAAIEPSTNGTASLSVSPSGHQISPDALQSRLQTLRGGSTSFQSPLSQEHRSPDHQDPSSGDSRHRDADYFSQSSSSSRSPGAPNGVSSGPGSEDVSRRTSNEEEESSGTPFAASGTHTPIPQFFHAEELTRVPSYSTAVRTPAPRRSIGSGLPSYAATTAVSGPAEPPSAHVRDRAAPASRQMNLIQNEERRLRILQHNGR